MIVHHSIGRLIAPQGERGLSSGRVVTACCQPSVSFGNGALLTTPHLSGCSFFSGSLPTFFASIRCRAQSSIFSREIDNAAKLYRKQSRRWFAHPIRLYHLVTV